MTQFEIKDSLFECLDCLESFLDTIDEIKDNHVQYTQWYD